MLVDTIACNCDVTCEYRDQLTTRCPVVDEPDEYGVVISWRPDGETYEKHALEGTVDSLSGRELSHEQLTERLYDALADADVMNLHVELRDTEHVAMTVTKP